MNAPQDQDVTLKLSLVNALLGYMGQRPYGEVFQLIGELHAQVGPQLQVKVEPAKVPTSAEPAGLTD